jgi:hypothetical protein
LQRVLGQERRLQPAGEQERPLGLLPLYRLVVLNLDTNSWIQSYDFGIYNYNASVVVG